MFMRAADQLGLVSRKSLWGQFWSSHQRFFKYLCIAAKIRCLVELAQKELEAGKVSTTLVSLLTVYISFHDNNKDFKYKLLSEDPSRDLNVDSLI